MAAQQHSTFARLPNHLSPEDEFLLLVDIKRNIDERLDRLFRELRPKVSTLPRSGFVQASPGALLFKTGYEVRT